MTKQELTYAQKFAILEPFHEAIFTNVKKDFRDEHLRTDRGFCKRNFGSKELSKITVEDLLRVYPKLIAAGYEPISEFISNRWLLRHLDIYNYFEDALKQHTEDFDKIEELEAGFARTLLDVAVTKFGAVDTYIFSILNSVAFSSVMMNELRASAIHSYARPVSTTA